MDLPTEVYTITTHTSTGILWTYFTYILYAELRRIHKGKRLDEKGTQWQISNYVKLRLRSDGTICWRIITAPNGPNSCIAISILNPVYRTLQECVAPLSFIREVPPSNLGPEIGYLYCDFSYITQALQENAELVSQIRQDRLLSHIFNCNVHWPLCHGTICSVSDRECWQKKP